MQHETVSTTRKVMGFNHKRELIDCSPPDSLALVRNSPTDCGMFRRSDISQQHMSQQGNMFVLKRL